MAAQKARATLRDVAERAGVSPAAVSKVVRGAYGVSDDMRDRVTAAIEEIGYRPNRAARAMRGASSTIGVELAGIGNPFFGDMLQAIMNVVADSRYQVLVAPSQSVEEEGRQALDALADHNVAGAIAVSPVVDEAWLERYARGTPLVVLGRHVASSRIDAVAADDADGTRQAMEHLLELGHRRIAHLTRSQQVTDPVSGSPHARRLAGYEVAMRKSGNGDSISVARSGPSEAEAFAETIRLLRGAHAPTAIFAANDELALGALRALGEAEFADRRVDVVGYDDVPVAGQPGIALSSVDQDGAAMGRRAAELLLERLAGRTEAVHEVLPVTLRVRASSAPRS